MQVYIGTVLSSLPGLETTVIGNTGVDRAAIKFDECYNLHGLHVRVSLLSSNSFTWNRKLHNIELVSKHCVPLL